MHKTFGKASHRRGYPQGKKDKKRCSTLLVIWELQTEATVRCPDILFRMTKMLKADKSKCAQGCDSHTAGRSKS
jgi:hypothetical protein